MVMHWRAQLAAIFVAAAAFTGATCKVVNEEHCANQEVPGNEFCVELNSATPYCSPCNRDFQGCVDFEPFACPGYSDELSDDEQDSNTPMEGTTTDDDDPPMSTGDEPMSTGGTTAAESDTSGGGDMTSTGSMTTSG